MPPRVRDGAEAVIPADPEGVTGITGWAAAGKLIGLQPGVASVPADALRAGAAARTSSCATTVNPFIPSSIPSRNPLCALRRARAIPQTGDPPLSEGDFVPAPGADDSFDP